MLKRITALVLSLLLLAAAVPMAASAATHDEIVSQISRLYRSTIWASGEESLKGWCGFMTGYQLYLLGVDTVPHTFNGKDEYNIYCAKELSTGGHRIRAYSANDYTLREALYTVCNGGTRDVYNILVGFQWSSTEAGQQYGHALLIHAILGGTVYFSESFTSNIGGREGNPIVCSIDRFVDYYDDWTQFEGLIVFGQKVYTDFCESYPAALLVKTTAAAPVLTQPEGEGSDAKTVRTASAGERFRVSEVLQTPEGRYFYRFTESGSVYYLPVEDTALLQSSTENVTLTGETAPTQLSVGKDFSLKGDVLAGDSMLGAVQTAVLDTAGEAVLSYEAAGAGRLCTLSGKKLNQAMAFDDLEAGLYTYQVTADVENYYVEAGELKCSTEKAIVYSGSFQVGEAAETQAKAASAEEPLRDGWVWENSTWYGYENGVPRTGWFREEGVSYYLQEDGAVTTGWANVNGRTRCFSDTGALCTGWLLTDRGLMYLLSNGIAAPEGWRTVGDGTYYLGENGITQTNAWLELEGAKYYLLSDGRIATGWTEVEGGVYCFRQDGRLMAQETQVGQQPVIQVYNEATGQFQSGY